MFLPKIVNFDDPTFKILTTFLVTVNKYPLTNKQRFCNLISLCNLGTFSLARIKSCSSILTLLGNGHQKPA